MEAFNILVQREKIDGSLVTGSISINGRVIGQTYENSKLMIPAGTYPVHIRYVSGHNFVQGPFGTIAKSGDFLLEIAHVPGRSAILFHGGNNAKQSKGCILLGAVGKDPKMHIPFLYHDHPLRKLRTLFYGTELPDSSPAKAITIRVSDFNACYL